MAVVLPDRLQARYKLSGFQGIAPVHYYYRSLGNLIPEQVSHDVHAGRKSLHIQNVTE
ncbi:MAG: hypothetical protein MR581_02975 [Lachnospiraceae bacterium]|nr:hypothetical protein [Lachnospiraceae bacterium]